MKASPSYACMESEIASRQVAQTPGLHSIHISHLCGSPLASTQLIVIFNVVLDLYVLKQIKGKFWNFSTGALCLKTWV